MNEKRLNEYVEMAKKLDEIFKSTGYEVLGFDPDFQMNNLSGGGGCNLKFSMAKRIIELYDMIPDDDSEYWISSRC
jgi:hypothetical protein